MSLDITPLTRKGRKAIRAYGDGGFTIGNDTLMGSLIVYPERVLEWSVTKAEDITLESLTPILNAPEAVELFIIGCGPRFVAPPKGLREALREQGVALEWMDTGAACRTQGLMIMEERDVVAALVAVE